MAFDLLLTNGAVATMDGDAPFGLVAEGAIAITGGKVAWIGRASDVPAGDAAGLSQGGRRWDLEPRGGGVGAMVKRTRLLSEEALYEASRARMSRLIANGVTTVESKSGSTLDKDGELMLMRVSRALGRDLPVTVVSTFLGAHGLAPEFAGRRDNYVDFMCTDVIPEAVKQGLVDQVDGFCDKVGFTHEQMSRLYAKAKSYGLPVKAHADQYTDFGVGALVARHGGLSADHLEFASLASVRAMAEAGTVATLLAGAHLTLHETRKPPVEMFREFGVPIALATNSNPVSSPTVSPASQMHLACYLFRLTPEEALRGFTVNGARALGLSNTAGRIAKGRPADLAVWDTPDPRGICYPIGGAPCLGVVKNGVVVYEAPVPKFGRA